MRQPSDLELMEPLEAVRHLKHTLGLFALRQLTGNVEQANACDHQLRLHRAMEVIEDSSAQGLVIIVQCAARLVKEDRLRIGQAIALGDEQQGAGEQQEHEQCYRGLRPSLPRQLRSSSARVERQLGDLPRCRRRERREERDDDDPAGIGRVDTAGPAHQVEDGNAAGGTDDVRHLALTEDRPEAECANRRVVQGGGYRCYPRHDEQDGGTRPEQDAPRPGARSGLRSGAIGAVRGFPRWGRPGWLQRIRQWRVCLHAVALLVLSR